jgi:hypothetical protein
LSAAAALDPANYMVVKQMKHGHKMVTHRLAFRAVYDAVTDSVQLVLKGRPKLSRGDRIVVSPTSRSTSSASPSSIDSAGMTSGITITILPKSGGAH